MTLLKDLPYASLQFYATAPYACSYLPDRIARSQVATPAHMIDTPLYSDLVRSGFRRSGVFTYRPHCDDCKACIPVRVPVARFVPDRSQRRAWTHNSELRSAERPLLYDEEHYELYQRYQAARHTGGGMDQDSREQYAHFLLQSHIDTRLVEFREAGVLRAISIIDCLTDGLSSVYTFYDPDLPHSSLGTFAVMWQIEVSRRAGLPYLYLGYWIRNSRKMVYKSRFRPLEGCFEGRWRELTDADLAPPGLDEPPTEPQ